MSLEMIAILRVKDLPDAELWQLAFARIGSLWRFEVGTDPWVARGFCAMRSGKVLSGVEIHEDTIKALPDHETINEPHRVLVLRFGRGLLEAACAISVAAALHDLCGAEIHDMSKSRTLIDGTALARNSVIISRLALQQNLNNLTTAKVVRAIAAMPEFEFKYLVGNNRVTRSVEGPILRCVTVERMSGGRYRLYAQQIPWCFACSYISLEYALCIDILYGDLDEIISGLRNKLSQHEHFRQVILADPYKLICNDRPLDPVVDKLHSVGVNRAVVCALNGDALQALPVLQSVIQRRPDWAKRGADHPWHFFPDLVACIESGGDVSGLFHAIAEEAKQRIVVKPIRRRLRPKAVG